MPIVSYAPLKPSASRMFRPLFRLSFRAGGALLVAAAALTGVVPAARAASLPDKTLVFCFEGNPAGFDNAQYTSGVEFTASAHTVYNRLIEFKPGTTDIEPGLAETWDVSPDGLQYTFHLRHGVKFQTTPFFKPTREFDADDVVFTFERLLDPGQPFNKAYPVSFPYVTDLGLATNVAKVEKLDPYTVRFTLKQVDAPFLQQIAMPFASILPLEYADQLLKEGKAADINLRPVGTGPFVFRSFTKDDTIRFDGNPDYWRPGDVKLGKLIFSITVDPAVRLQKLKRGECQVMSQPRPADIAQIKADPSLQALSQVGFNVGYVSYNVTKKPLDNLLVRRALDMAVDKPAIVESVYQGAGQLATNPMPPIQWGYNKNLKDAPYDVAKAKALLAQAGFPNGFDIKLWAMPVTRPYNPNARLMAEMLQSDWAKIGVRAQIVTYEWGEYLRRAKAGEAEIMLIGWSGDYGDPDNWLGPLLSCDAVNGSNYGKWCYKPFDDLVKAGRSTTDMAQRTKDYMQAQVIFKDQVPFTPIAHSTVYQPVSKNVTGFRIDPTGSTEFLGVGLK